MAGLGTFGGSSEPIEQKAGFTGGAEGESLLDKAREATQASAESNLLPTTQMAAEGTNGQALTSNGTTTGPAYQGMTTQGDVEYHNGTDRARLAAGTAGQALTTAGAAANPAFAGMTTQGDVEYHNGTTRTRLAPGTTGQLLRTNGAGANPAWASLAGDVSGAVSATTVTDLTITGEAQGDVLYFNGTNWVRLAPGTAGQFLQTQGAAANPQWASINFEGARVSESINDGADSTNISLVLDVQSRVFYWLTGRFSAVDGNASSFHIRRGGTNIVSTDAAVAWAASQYAAIQYVETLAAGTYAIDFALDATAGTQTFAGILQVLAVPAT